MSEITPVHFLRYKIIPKNNLSLGRAFLGLSAVSIYYTLLERLGKSLNQSKPHFFK